MSWGKHMAKGEIINLTVSIGIAYFDGKCKEITSDELIKQADTALYHVKEKGRNRIEVF